MPNAQVLRQVREQRRLDLDEVADLTNISGNRLRQFEDGDRAPSFRQLERLAEVYGIPSYYLSGKTLPNLPEIPTDFRRRQPQPAELSPAGLQKIWNAERIAQFTHQLSVELEVGKPQWHSKVPTGKPTTAFATELRAFFDEWHSLREKSLDFHGSPEQNFLGALRLFLEVQGTVVNQNDAPSDDSLGFYLDSDAGSPLIFVNRKISSRKAQLFTLAHELAHRLLDATGVSNPFLIRNDIERMCNQFAAEFLAPMRWFEALVREQPRDLLGDVFSLIRIISRRSLLSMKATGIRLVEGGYLKQEQYQHWESVVFKIPSAEKDEEAAEAGALFAPPHAKRVSELGYLPIVLAMVAKDRKIIDALDIERGLGLSEGMQSDAFSLASRRVQAAAG
jgi:Zn-dependent peptidase ImmA (M78 family)/transcriptional regulator with XRE-family HTH domain